MSYSDLVIVKGKNLRQPSYIEFYMNEQRIREYCGSSIKLLIEPNQAHSVKERDRLLLKLEYEIHKALDTNSYPATEFTIRRKMPIGELLDYSLKYKIENGRTAEYIRNQRLCLREFKNFLTSEELSRPVTQITTAKIEEYLRRGDLSPLRYMRRRSHLSALFVDISKYLDINLSMVKNTEFKIVPRVLHEPYTKTQLKNLLDYLNEKSPKLYLLCLLVYGCFLRPHQEARNLKMSHFKKDFTEIHLASSENKGRKIRLMPVPTYVQDELRKLKLKRNDYLFGHKGQANGLSYFGVLWCQIKTELLELGLIQQGQSIYTFRHSAAVNIYEQTKDIYVVQRFLGHARIDTTVLYLTGLGIIYREEDLRANMPTLEF